MKRLLLILLLLPVFAEAQIITTVAGNGSSGYGGDGGMATLATLNNPTGLAADNSGNFYIADEYNNRIRKVTSTGIIKTIAGTGVAGYSGDGSAATDAQLNQPIGVCIDASGSIYIADYYNNKIRKINSTGTINTIAGNGSLGYTGDGGPATSAELARPRGVAVDAFGNVYFADEDNQVVRKITPTGTISTIAGNGSWGFSGDGGPATAAQLWSPQSVAIDATGNVYISDMQNSRIRKVNTSGTISTYAGGGSSLADGIPATAGNLWVPKGIAVDASGNLYIADNFNYRLRKVNSLGFISTIAGDGTIGSSGDGGFAIYALVADLQAVAVDNIGRVYIGDIYVQTIRMLDTCTIPSIGSISGADSVCAGAAIHLSDITTGGIWSSNSTLTATVGSASGIVIGVTSGSVTISYTVHNSCGIAIATKVITVNPLPTTAGSITGLSDVCEGATIVLTDAVSGGIWTSLFPGIASISSAGIVTGVTVGADTLKYSFTNSCGTSYATHPITVNPLPSIASITGSTILCAGTTNTVSDSVLGGSWSSRLTSVATINTSGIINAIAPGIDTIVYTIINSCGIVSVLQAITVNPLPFSGTISGLDSICAGDTVTLTNTVTDGTWGIMNSTIATISSAGLISGLSSGYDTILYTVSNSCGTDTASFPFVVSLCLSGIKQTNNPPTNSLRIYPNPSQNEITIASSHIITTIAITNLFGQTLYSSQYNSPQVQIDVAALPAGVYFVKVNGTEVRKFVKQ